MRLNKLQVALGLGIFISGLHLLWVLAIAIMPAFMQKFLNWIFGLHFLKPVYFLEPATWTKGILLVLITFVCGFLMGLFFSWAYNLMAAKKKTFVATVKKAPVVKKKRR